MLCGVFLQIVPADDLHELLPAVRLFEFSLDVLLHEQACFMVSVDRFRPSGVYMVLPAEIDLEAPAL